MSSSPYAGALGRIKPHLTEFLGAETYPRLLGSHDLGEVAKILESGPYGPEILKAAVTLQGAPMIEAAVNATFAGRTLHAYNAGSFAGRPIVGLYLQRWDIENLSVILSGKARGKLVGTDEHRLVSWRERPAGVPAGSMTLDDLRGLIEQPTIEASMAYLVRFGYGPTLLPLGETFARTGDIFPLVQALEIDYYERLFARLRFFQGDEWVVREYLRVEVDHRNVLLLLKAKEAGLAAGDVAGRWIPGGSLAEASAPELLGAAEVTELVANLAARFPPISQGLDAYRATHTLAGFESSLRKERLRQATARMRAYPVSLAILMVFLLLAECERADLRRIVYGTLYGVAREEIAADLLGTT